MGFHIMIESVNMSKYLPALSFIFATTVLHNKQIQISGASNSIQFVQESVSCLGVSKLAYLRGASSCVCDQ